MSNDKARTKHPIAVVGMACLFPKAGSLKGYWQVIRMGVDTISEVPDSHWRPEDYFDDDKSAPDKTYCRRGGFLDPYGFDPTEFSMPPTALEATDTSQLLGLVVAKAALEDAGYGPDRTFDKETTSVILGVTGCLELVIPLGARLGHPYWRRALLESGIDEKTTEEVMQRIAQDYVPWQENSFPGLLGNVVAGRIANKLDLHGSNCVVDAACASTLSAAHLAALELECGRADMVVTGGADTFNDIFMYMCFSKTPALSPSGKIRPFDAESDGTLIGEGIGMAVLKRLEDAERDGDRVYAVIKGIGTSSDGSQKAVYAPYSPGQARALERAYDISGVSPTTIDLVEAHGTGTKVGDVVEFEALKGVYSAAGATPQSVALGSVKSQIGHTKAAAGAAGLIKASLALHHKVLPPTINVKQPNPKLGLEDSPFYLNTEARPWLTPEGHPRRAALSSFGFGGSNYHTVLEEHGNKREQPAWDGSVEMLAYCADTREALLRQMEGDLNAKKHDPARRGWQLRQQFDKSKAFRCLVVGPIEKLLGELEKTVNTLKEGKNPEFYGEGDCPGPVAFLFPGQGSQYVGMARELSCIFPEFLDSLDGVGREVAEKIYPVPVFDKALQKGQQAELTATQIAQPALGAINSGMHNVLRRFGLQPAYTGGHSYGELCALYAAGVFDAASLYELSRLRGELMNNQGEDLGTMLAVTGPLEQVEAVIKEAKLKVKLANRNSPTQGVLSGSRKDIEAAAPVMKEAGLNVIPLQVAAAFHSELVAGARDPFRKGMNKLKFGKPEVPVYANKTAKVYPGTDKKSKDLLADQLVHEVDFVGQIRQMYEDGARIFVEVGPKRVLSRLVSAILKGEEHQSLALDASQGKGRPLVDLAKALAKLAALGVEVDLTAWELEPKPQRPKRMEVILSGANYRPESERMAPSSRQLVDKNSITPAPVAPSAAPVAPKAATPAPAPRTSSAPAQPAPAPAPNPALAEALHGVQASLKAMQTLAQQTAEAHQQFLKGQEVAQRTFQQMVGNQQHLLSRLGSGAASAPAQPVAAPTSAPRVTPLAPTPVAPSVSAPPATAVVKPVPSSAPAPAARPAPAPVPVQAAVPGLEQAILQTVAEKTGYPAEMLNLEMDLEADLGIDSIKRVEILAAVEEAVPGLPKVEPDQMGALRTLAQIVEALGAGSSAPTAAPVADPGVANKLLEVVAQKTGYPTEMLNLEMDLEADLGIDSIKRVEILAAVEEAVPGLPKVEPDQMGALRTLGQIVEALGASPAATPAAAPSADSGVAKELLEVVALKTGYPTEMLNLEMDLEADLGIDSIKRVEILAAVEEAIPGLPKVEPDQMGALRTLGQIVDALGGSSAPVFAAEAVSAAGSGVAHELLEVVAQKTGYPTDMLNLEMDLEADLGIDSIKRVEILAAVEEAIPGLPKIEADQMGALRTLGQIVEALGEAGTASAPAVSTGVASKLLEVVAAKTGYPTEMLNMEMDLEADLGIDSIKRVEILAAVEESIPGLPKIEADQMGALRTLGQIVEALGASPAASAPTAVSEGDLESVLLGVVADKTGYPTEMLNLDMDLEADLGIDSIKRVEILATVEEKHPGLAKVEADQMGSLRTLRQVLAAISAGTATEAPAAVHTNGSVHSNTPATVLQRQVLRPVDIGPGNPQPLPLPAETTLVVVEDKPGLGESIVQAFASRGLKARLLEGGDLPDDLGGLLLVGNGSKDDSQFLKAAFRFTQQAAPKLRKNGGMLVTVTRMDGHFGTKSKSFSAIIGGLAGLPKTVAHEWPEVFTRAIDLAPELDGEAVVDEISSAGPLEVALAPGLRQGLAIEDSEVTEGDPYLTSSDVVVITGGARGVTAATAVALARSHQPKLVLLGRSAEPQPEPAYLRGLSDAAAIKKTLLAEEFQGKATPAELESSYRRHMANREIRSTLEQLRAAGSEVIYRSVDVRDGAAMKTVLDEAASQLGPVTGVIHGAGVLADRKIEDKTQEQFDSVYDTKLQGLQNLLAHTKDLKALVLFSSVTARFGRPGQLDYCMANEAMNKIAQLESRRRPRCKVVALGWGPWDGGMVNPALRKEFERLGVGLIPLKEGSDMLVAELSHRANEVEVLIGDGFPEPEQPKGSKKNASALMPVLQKKLSTNAFPFLSSHVIGGRPVLPMALMMEWFAHAALHGNIGLRFFAVEDFRVLRGLVLEEGLEPTITVVASAPENEEEQVRVRVELRDLTRDILHARATVVLVPELPAAPSVEPVNGLASKSYPHDSKSIYENLLFHGHHFHGIKAVEGYSDEGLVAELAVAPKPSKWVADPVRSDWLTDPLVVDGVLQLGILWCIEALQKPSLPNGGAVYRQYRKKFPKKGTTVHLKVEQHSAHRLVAHAYLVDAKGELVASFTGLEWTADANLKKAFAKKEPATRT